MSNAMVTQTKLFLEKRTPELTRFARGGVQANALTMLALQELTNNPAVRDATPQSVYCALLACAITGLEPGSLKQEAFLVPFKRRVSEHGQPDRWVTEVKFLVGWRGIVKQAMRAGGIRWIRSAIVHEGDLFEIDNAASSPIVHKPRIGTAPGAILGAYALAKLTNGEFQHEWLDIQKLEQIRKFANSKKPSPAWEQWPEEMYRKSAVRALGKYLPMDETYFNAERLEQAHYDAEGPGEIEVLDLLTDGAASADLRDGGPAAGFTAALPPAPAAKPADKPRAPAKDKPIDVKATEAKDPAPAAPSPSAAPASPPSPPPSSSASSTSPTTASPSAPSSAPTETSKSASTSSAPPPDEDAGQANEPSDTPDGDDEGGDPFGDDPPAAEPHTIHGFPASMAGFDAWLKATKTRDALKDQIDGWRTWARDVAKFDPGYKPSGPSDPTPARAPSPEIAGMHERFNAHWRVTK